MAPTEPSYGYKGSGKQKSDFEVKFSRNQAQPLGFFFSTVVISVRWAFCTFVGYFTCPSGSEVGAIDRSDPSKHVFDPYCTLEVLRKIFMDRVWAILPQKSAKNGIFLAFYKGFMHKALIKGQKRSFLADF